MEPKEITEHLVALKVMRLTKPALVSPKIVTCDSKDLLGNILNNYLKEDATSVAQMETLAAGQFLLLPQSFASFRKFFKFEVMKPLDVKTKFYNAESDDVYLEAQVQNITSGPITLEQCLQLTSEELERREVDFLDIAYDEIKAHHYKESEDPRFFKSVKTGRGPLVEGWRDNHQPIMCCYKAVHAKFEVWGLQTRVEEFIQSAIREILLLGHRQAFTWMDDWYDMTIEDLKISMENSEPGSISEEDKSSETSSKPETPKSPKTPQTPKSSTITPSQEAKSWFSWS
ncbi:Cytoplasmic phosphatidylinositol transfer protein 1 [Eumeta japonica]|uniref:Cytoplasmic phosphatidylinositol transfer protein 1 n=1 Tax=Eumeta variegata TaxID=151549 RepID=A0A4C1UAX5_EUMVA|nr:Cytoplasmic phosphatidylinositol transfer protein 1 [Eumeta japonica]